MLLEERTLEQFGYEINTLTKGTHKKVVVACDYCSKEYFPQWKAMWVGRRKFEAIGLTKDCCKPCGPYKTAEADSIKGITEEKAVKKQEKIKQTFLKNYGVDHPNKLPEMAKKLSERWDSMSEEEIGAIVKKRRATCKEKYGVEEISQVPEIRRKVEETMIKRYGATNASYVEEFKEKRRATTEARHGDAQFFKTETFRERSRATCLEKYGVEHSSQVEFVKEKIFDSRAATYADPIKREDIYQRTRNTTIERYGVPFVTQNPETQKKMFQSRLVSGHSKLYDGKSIVEWATEKNITRGYARTILETHGTEFLSTFEKGQTDIEKILEDILKEINCEYKHGATVENRKTDFLVNNNLVLEADGLYWHSDLNNKPDNYHVEKRNFYLSKGLVPLFFRSDEILKTPLVVKSIILNNLGQTPENIHAEECQVVEGSVNDAKEWFGENHLLDARTRGRFFYLRRKDTLETVCGMQAVDRGEDKWEICRFAPKLMTTVPDGFDKLLIHMQEKIKPSVVSIFIDLRYDNGDHLSILGFEKKTENPSFRWTDGRVSLHRAIYFGNTGYENGLGKIWDCGQAKWEKVVSGISESQL